MERKGWPTPDPVNDSGIDDLELLMSREGLRDDRADQESDSVHPFDREDPHDLGPDPASSRTVTQDERDVFWSKMGAQPWSFDFFAAVRRLEALYPELPGFGASSRSAEDTVRFSQHPSLAFAPCTISEVRPQSDKAPTRVFVNFIGMLGPNGPMPLHLTDHAKARELHHKDFTFSRFLDVFNHRMASLFYRAWAVNNMPASFDRTPPAALEGNVKYEDREKIFASEKDRYPVYVGSLIGIGMDALRHRDAVPDNAKLHFSGRLVGYQKGPEGLRAILSSYFKVPVHIDEFAGRWLPLPDRYYTRLGGGPSVASDPDAQAAATLGSLAGGAAIVGRHVWDSQGMFRVFLGPMKLADFIKFVPGSPSEHRLRAWIRNYLGDEFAWEAVIILDAADVPKAMLAKEPKAGVMGTRLGWTSWIRSKPETRNRPDMHVRSEQPGRHLR